MHIGVRSKVSNEVNQYLRLESNARMEGDVALTELYRPLGELIRELWLVYDALQWKGDEYDERVTLEVRPKLLGYSDQG